MMTSRLVCGFLSPSYPRPVRLRIEFLLFRAVLCSSINPMIRGLRILYGFYVEVLDRLPIHDYPNLVHCIFVAGHCYGLLEPVSNIILHAIAHGPRRYKRKVINGEFHHRRYWLPAARRSLDGLTTFLMSMYRYITKDQAVRYLSLAQADIHLAMDLIEREFDNKCRVEEALPPAFDESSWVPIVEDAVTYAALAAEHPSPDCLVALATKTFGAHHVHKLAAWLRADRIDKVAVDDMYDSLICRHAPDGLYLHSLRVRYPDPDTGNACNKTCCVHRCPSLLHEDQITSELDSSISRPCNYIKRIEALLVDYIHALHLSAISRLSPDSVKMLHRGLVVAGYLFGPFDDPVFNILVNAIWYQLNVPARDNDDYSMPPPPVDLICTDRMLRNGFNALMAQVVFLCSKYGMSSGHDALEYIYFTNCALHAAAELAQEAGHHASDDLLSAATEAAVKAMKHPRPAAMMALMASFTPELEAKLCDLLPAKGHELSSEAIDEISRLLSSHVTLSVTISPPAATMVHQGALADIEQERRDFKRKQIFLMERVQSLLDKNYKVHTICAVARSHVQSKEIYHVNFLATRTDVDDGNQVSHELFFAQVVRAVCRRRRTREITSCEKNWKRSFCCPVTISAFLGRCFLCEFQAAKIVHPISIGMEYHGRQEKTYINFMNYVAGSPHKVHNYKMNSDFIYFDPTVNTELAKYLNERAKKQDEMTEEEVFLRSIPCE